ncbi:hypothetical protein [Caballeronia novacaledonica]|uniref:hypothetical protein n=1 Tax=Caballeronia novacaledonica TaxID=1544861 RepID=UPI0011B22174|nr:hypothetical protein [Caballeronia novacaledonica]
MTRPDGAIDEALREKDTHLPAPQARPGTFERRKSCRRAVRGRSTVYWVLEIVVLARGGRRRAVKRALSTQKGNGLEYAVIFGAQTDITVSFFPVCFSRRVPDVSEAS